MIVEFEEKVPQVSSSAFVAENATLIGDVCIHEDGSVWYGAVLRGDESSIVVGARSNVQDNATIHCDRGMPVIIGEDVTIGHNAIIHSCTIGNKAVIGMGAVILNLAVIGEGCIVAAGSVVTGKMEIPPYTMVAGAPAVIKKTYGAEIADKNLENASEYVRLASKYKINQKQ